MGIHCRLAKHWKYAGLLAHSLHCCFVVTPNVAVVEPYRTEIARVQLLAGADVIGEFWLCGFSCVKGCYVPARKGLGSFK